MLLGLVTPSEGDAWIDGNRYADLHNPFRRVGAMLETDAFHPGRRARDHLRILATAADLPAKRVEAVLEEVDLVDAGIAVSKRSRSGCASGSDSQVHCSVTRQS
jgi:ABC-2 type transport system ATP-binding protein